MFYILRNLILMDICVSFDYTSKASDSIFKNAYISLIIKWFSSQPNKMKM